MSRARLPIALGVVIVMLGAAVGGLVLLGSQLRAPADQPVPATAPSPIRGPTDRPEPPGTPAPAQTPLPTTAPAPPAPTTKMTLQALLEELNAALPKLGVQPPARLTAATVERDLLTLTFNTEFQPYLADLSALDELTAALSSRASTHGYRHLALRVVDSRGRSRSIDELTTTPPDRRPRPEPIDDGVRR